MLPRSEKVALRLMGKSTRCIDCSYWIRQEKHRVEGYCDIDGIERDPYSCERCMRFCPRER